MENITVFVLWEKFSSKLFLKHFVGMIGKFEANNFQLKDNITFLKRYKDKWELLRRDMGILEM